VKASDVLGRQIIVRDGGHDIGKIKDLIVDPTGHEVIGIVLSDSMFSGSRVAPWRAVQAFGPDSVIIDIASSVVKGSTLPEIKAVLDKKTRIKGLKLVTTKGKELGKIVDFDFDESSGELIGYELSSGLFSDSVDGTPFLPTPQWIELGRDVAFVAPEVEATVRSSGGVHSAFKRQERQSPLRPENEAGAASTPAPAPDDGTEAGADGGTGTGPGNGPGTA
jgi:uncharacterized protein YrrD